MGTSGNSALMNSCTPISSVSAICPAGTLACQLTTSTGDPFKLMANSLNASLTVYDDGKKPLCDGPHVLSPSVYDGPLHWH